MRVAASTLLVLSLLSGPAVAQVGGPSPAAPARTFAPSHLAAARELLDAILFEETAMAAAMSAFDQQAAASPESAAFRDLVEEWTREVFSGEEAKAAFAGAYAERLAEADLRGLVAFYRTDLGKRLATQLPELAVAGARIGQQLAAQHQAALQERIMARAAELQAEGE